MAESVAQAKGKAAAETETKEQRETTYEVVTREAIGPALREFADYLRDQHGLDSFVERSSIRLRGADATWEIKRDDSFPSTFALAQMYPDDKGPVGGKQEIKVDDLTKERVLSMLAEWFDMVLYRRPSLVQ